MAGTTKPVVDHSWTSSDTSSAHVFTVGDDSAAVIRWHGSGYAPTDVVGLVVQRQIGGRDRWADFTDNGKRVTLDDLSDSVSVIFTPGTYRIKPDAGFSIAAPGAYVRAVVSVEPAGAVRDDFLSGGGGSVSVVWPMHISSAGGAWAPVKTTAYSFENSSLFTTFGFNPFMQNVHPFSAGAVASFRFSADRLDANDPSFFWPMRMLLPTSHGHTGGFANVPRARQYGAPILPLPWSGRIGDYEGLRVGFSMFMLFGGGVATFEVDKAVNF